MTVVSILASNSRKKQNKRVSQSVGLLFEMNLKAQEELRVSEQLEFSRHKKQKTKLRVQLKSPAGAEVSLYS